MLGESRAQCKVLSVLYLPPVTHLGNILDKATPLGPEFSEKQLWFFPYFPTPTLTPCLVGV